MTQETFPTPFARLKQLATTHQQALKFAVIGGGTTVFDLIAYYVLTRYVSFFGDHIVITKITTFATISLFSFFANRIWTFQSTTRATWAEFVRFYITIFLAIAINAGTLALLTPVFNHDLPAAFCATITTFIWNFTVSKRWVFRGAKT